MIRKIKVALAATAFTCILAGLLYFLQSNRGPSFFYFLLMSFPVLLIVTFLVALVYFFISKHIRFKNKWIASSVHMLTLGLISVLVFGVWSILEVWSYYGNFESVTPAKVFANYKHEFGLTIPSTMITGITLVISDKLIVKTTNENSNK